MLEKELAQATKMAERASKQVEQQSQQAHQGKGRVNGS